MKVASKRKHVSTSAPTDATTKKRKLAPAVAIVVATTPTPKPARRPMTLPTSTLPTAETPKTRCETRKKVSAKAVGKPERGDPDEAKGAVAARRTKRERAAAAATAAGKKKEETKKKRKMARVTANTSKKGNRKQSSGRASSRNRRSRRKRAPTLTAADFASDPAEDKDDDRRRWGCYLQMDAARQARPYVGKTPHLVRRTGQHRRGLCARTRRFGGDLSPVWFVDAGFGCDRDVQQFEWRLQHELAPKRKFRGSFGGEAARARRDQATERVRVEARVKPSAQLDRALRALCSMLQVTQWTTGAVPIGHEWRARLPGFVVHWFGPDPACYGYDIKRLQTAYPVRHVFGCALEGFTGSATPTE